VCFGGVVLGLRQAGAGQIGVFPEHAGVAAKILSRCESPVSAPVRVLNLFAHTGLATLMLAASGRCEIAHVDGAAVAVKQARENAALSGLADRPVRWLVDDALGFMRREARRGKRYDVILADPPAFGRGGKGGGEWKLERDLPVLLGLAKELLDGSGLLALTCHSEGWDGERLSGAVREYAGMGKTSEEELTLAPETERGRALPGGRLLFACR
jgi:23S rRNA (cytosine1962-C5)-methyltransferase